MGEEKSLHLGPTDSCHDEFKLKKINSNFLVFLFLISITTDSRHTFPRTVVQSASFSQKKTNLETSLVFNGPLLIFLSLASSEKRKKMY